MRRHGSGRPLPEGVREKLLAFQRNEMTEHLIYAKLAGMSRNPHNRRLLERISRDELRHYGIWKKHTGADASPSAYKLWKYVLIARLLGLTFGLKLMERGEEGAQESYGFLSGSVPEAEGVQEEENRHEAGLLDMIDEQKLRYVGSIVLGLNDALVELTGTLAGLTFAFQNSQLISLAGLITGIAASLSMGASEYLSTKSEGSAEGGKKPGRASLYTTAAYILTVLFLISPYFLLPDYFLALGVTVINAVIVIFVFTFYVSVAKGLAFRRRFAEMAFISLGVAGLTFVIGVLVRVLLGIDV
jgi:VIT1/CCC1 family predicted Fe2+/Mn2+ transporter